MTEEQNNVGTTTTTTTSIADWKMPFGKYRGLTYSDMLKRDEKYVRWIVNNSIIKNKKVLNFLDESITTPKK